MELKMSDKYLSGLRGLKQIWKSIYIKKQGNTTPSDDESFSNRVKAFLNRNGYIHWYNKL